ncbi:MAG: hypothetical protein IPN71_07160 [Fibrobacteres bacterium]|nr:hypothetical protein [Fibrobacterota bacterium]
MELSKFLDDLRKSLPSARPFFGIIFDLSTTGPINPEVRDLLLHSMRFLASRGMVRTAACVANGLLASQLRRLLREAGTGEGLRCIDVHKDGWKLAAEHWAVSGHEPGACLFVSGNPTSEM